jgi:hypothetical protein
MQTSFVGSPIDDPSILDAVPEAISQSLHRLNGFISKEGGFHVRGGCSAPLWHSLRAAWKGEFALHRLFPLVKSSDIPFAEDCFGDQYLLRHDQIVRLHGETGEIEELHLSWSEFLSRVDSEPLEYLELNLLREFQHEGGELLPGQLLSVYPPFVANYDGKRSMKAIASLERITWLADLARQIATIPDGQQVRIEVK